MKAIVFVLLVPFLMFGQVKQDVQEEPKTIIDTQLPEFEVSPDEFIYKPENRRDPFWSLLQAGKKAESREAIEGIGGLLVDELELEGVIFSSGSYKALVKGPDSRPYVVKIGEKVYDGEIIRIDAYSISFRKILTVALGGQKEKIIIKTLIPEEEGVKKDEKIE